MSISNSSLFSAESPSQGHSDGDEWRSKIPTITLTNVSDPSDEPSKEQGDGGVNSIDHTTILVHGSSPASSEEEPDPDNASDDSWHSAQKDESGRRDSTDTVVRLSIGGADWEQDADSEEESETQDRESTFSNRQGSSKADDLRDELRKLTNDELRNYTREETFWHAEGANVTLGVLRERGVLNDEGEGPIAFCTISTASTPGRRSKWSLSRLWEVDTK